MVRAVVLIKSPLALVADKAKRVEGVNDAFNLRGRFDAVAYVDADNNVALRKAILRIQAIKDVNRTETLIEL